jgi:tRNA1(Val) A37 N6-methylase TrmN6
VLRTCIGLRKYIASQFRPATAKAVYDYFGAEDVLDFSSGWGDRLCGFLASDAKYYVGIDPNERLFSKYELMLNHFNVPNKKVELFNSCAEDVLLGGRRFDLVFTSPPYFNIERYTQEDNQSFKKYRKLENWLNDFLFRAINLSWSHLKKGGHLVLNISDVYSNHTINKICDPMNDYIKSLKGAKYIGCYGYQMMVRPNSGALKGKAGKFAEPMWVWKKL